MDYGDEGGAEQEQAPDEAEGSWHEPRRAEDPQDTLQATLRRSKRSDNEILTFSYRIAFFEIAFIVNLPDDDAKVGDRFAVYAKYKLHRRRQADDRD